MVQLQSTGEIDVRKFIEQYGDDTRYELIDGELIDMKPTGLHEQVCALISRKLNVEIDRLSLPYFIPHRCLLKLLSTITAFRPDVIVLDEIALKQEPLWLREPIITNGKTVKLVVEVVSSNWQNDYARKYEDYEALKIPEYWIVDYLGIGGKYYIGNPKQPTVTICRLVNNVYEKILLRQGNKIISSIFPYLQLTTNQLFGIARNE